MRHLCESGLRENCTSRLSGGRRPALWGRLLRPDTTAMAEAVQQTENGSFTDGEPSTGVLGLLGILLAIIGIGATTS